MTGEESNVYPIRKSNGKVAEPIEPRITLLSDFWGQTPEPPEYIVDQLIPKRRVTLLVGKAGYGKTYISQMLMNAASVGKDWLGLTVRKCRSFGIFSEDPREEIHRRQIAICNHYDTDMRDLEDFGSIVSNDDEDFSLYLCARKHEGGIARTLWTQFAQRCEDEGNELIILDNVTNIFEGDIYNRAHVNGFLRWFNKEARRLNASVVILCNPPKDNRASYFSGTQVWEDSARTLISLSAAVDRQGNDIEGEFVLKVMKNSYLPHNHPLKRAGIMLQWQDDVLQRMPEVTLDHLGRLDLESRMIAAVKHCTDKLGYKLAAEPNSPNYLPGKLVEKSKVAGQMPWGELVSALDRLLTEGRLVKVAVKGAWLIRTPDGEPYLGERE